VATRAAPQGMQKQKNNKQKRYDTLVVQLLWHFYNGTARAREERMAAGEHERNDRWML